MVTNMRNWWIEGSADGRANPVSFGPRSRDGGFDIKVRQRADGQSIQVARMAGYVTREGKLALWIEAGDGSDVYRDDTGNRPDDGLVETNYKRGLITIHSDR